MTTPVVLFRLAEGRDLAWSTAAPPVATRPARSVDGRQYKIINQLALKSAGWNPTPDWPALC